MLVTFLGKLKEVIRKGFKVTSNLADKKITLNPESPSMRWFPIWLQLKLLCRFQFVFTYHIYTWNPNDPCFDWKGPCFGGLKPKNRGQIGSRYILWENLLTMIIHHIRWPFLGLSLFFCWEGSAVLCHESRFKLGGGQEDVIHGATTFVWLGDLLGKSR